MSSEKINKLLDFILVNENGKVGLKNVKNVVIFALGPFCCSQTVKWR